MLLDFTDQSLLVQVGDGLAGESAIDLKLVGNVGNSDHPLLGDIGDHLLVQLLVEQDVALDLVLGLALAPLLQVCCVRDAFPITSRISDTHQGKGEGAEKRGKN